MLWIDKDPIPEWGIKAFQQEYADGFACYFTPEHRDIEFSEDQDEAMAQLIDAGKNYTNVGGSFPPQVWAGLCVHVGTGKDIQFNMFQLSKAQHAGETGVTWVYKTE